MAETVVAPVIDRLVQLLITEAKLLKGVNRDVESLKDELESIKSFLKDAEARSEIERNNDGVKTWVKKVSDEANSIEDVIDEYLRHVTPSRRRSGFLNFLKKIGCLIKRLKVRHIIGSEVRNLKTSLQVRDMTSKDIPRKKYVVANTHVLNNATLDWIPILLKKMKLWALSRPEII